jgi:hypothetical protein
MTVALPARSAREEALVSRVRHWHMAGHIDDPRSWLNHHGLVALLPDLYGDDARDWGRRVLSENLMLLQEAGTVLGALREAGVRTVSMKGIDILGRLYEGREAFRRTTDMDVLVDHRRLDRALDVVESLGFRHCGTEPRDIQARYGAEVEYEGPRGMRLEVHHELLLDAGFDVTLEELDHGGLIETGAGPHGSDRLSLDALTVHLLVHLAKHRLGGDSLRWVFDILLLLDHFGDRLDGRALVDTATRMRGRRAAGASVASIARLLPDVDLGALAALPTGGPRQWLALWLVDAERVALRGEAGFSRAGSVLSRLALDPGLGATLSFLKRKRQLRRARAG